MEGEPITFACPGCGQKLRIQPRDLGRKAACPKCRAPIQPPAAGSSGSADAPPSPDPGEETPVRPLPRVEPPPEPGPVSAASPTRSEGRGPVAPWIAAAAGLLLAAAAAAGWWLNSGALKGRLTRALAEGVSRDAKVASLERRLVMEADGAAAGQKGLGEEIQRLRGELDQAKRDSAERIRKAEAQRSVDDQLLDERLREVEGQRDAARKEAADLASALKIALDELKATRDRLAKAEAALAMRAAEPPKVAEIPKPAEPPKEPVAPAEPPAPETPPVPEKPKDPEPRAPALPTDRAALSRLMGKEIRSIQRGNGCIEILGDLPEARLAEYAPPIEQTLAEHMQLFQWKPDPKRPMRVILFSEEALYRSFTDRYGRAARWPEPVLKSTRDESRGFRQGSVREPFLASFPGGEDLRKDQSFLVHTFAHLLLDNTYTLRELPTWVEEGYAYFMEYERIHASYSYCFEVRKDYRGEWSKSEQEFSTGEGWPDLIKKAVIRNEVLPFGELQLRTLQSLDHTGRATSWSYVHIFSKGDGARFRDFIRRAKEGADAREALEAAFGQSTEDLQKAWRRNIMRLF